MTSPTTNIHSTLAEILNLTPEEQKHDLTQVPKWILYKLRDECKLRREVEKELQETKKQQPSKLEPSPATRPRTESKSKVDSIDELLKRIRPVLSQNTDLSTQLDSWVSQQLATSVAAQNREKELLEVIKDKDVKLEKQKQLIADAVQKLKQYKETQASTLQELLSTKDQEIMSYKYQIKKLRERLKKDENADEDSEGSFHSVPTPKHATTDALTQKSPRGSLQLGGGGLVKDDTRVRERSHSMDYAASLDKMQSELAKHHTDSKSKSEQITLEIAEINIRKHKLELTVEEGEKAKKEIPELEARLQAKRKELMDAIKDIKIAQTMKQKEKQKAEELENMQSIVKDTKKRHDVLKSAGKFNVKQNILEQELKTEGLTLISLEDRKEEEKTQSLGEDVAARCISLYPFITGARQGDPIADRYAVKCFQSSTIVALCDGCGWGANSREAALIAAKTFVEEMRKLLSDSVSTRHAVLLMLRAFQAIQSSILGGKADVWSAGTTTILGGLLLPLVETEVAKWVFVFLNLGDCKAYHWSAKQRKVTDITAGNRLDINDMRDPGGRLGPYVEKGEPDLRNLNAGFALCSDNDIIIIVSDGVHDNIDPEVMGLLPSQVGMTNLATDAWSAVEDKKAEERIRAEFSLRFLENLIEQALSEQEKMSLNNQNTKSNVVSIVEKLTSHSYDLTKKGREFMEKYEKRLPDDHVAYPGKMDHCTAVALRVGKKTDPAYSTGRKRTF
mmetsp:Transcript_3052/g.4142  ORF Transcript_3052/g.4142 Transcript_3052/m.4142 type:complete len:733 (-) Transcript_3052:739-2937(-)